MRAQNRASPSGRAGQAALETGAQRASLSEPLLRPAQAADLLSVRTSWIYEAVRARRLPCVRVGRHVSAVMPSTGKGPNIGNRCLVIVRRGLALPVVLEVLQVLVGGLLERRAGAMEPGQRAGASLVQRAAQPGFG